MIKLLIPVGMEIGNQSRVKGIPSKNTVIITHKYMLDLIGSPNSPGYYEKLEERLKEESLPGRRLRWPCKLRIEGESS